MPTLEVPKAIFGHTHERVLLMLNLQISNRIVVVPNSLFNIWIESICVHLKFSINNSPGTALHSSQQHGQQGSRQIRFSWKTLGTLRGSSSCGSCGKEVDFGCSCSWQCTLSKLCWCVLGNCGTRSKRKQRQNLESVLDPFAQQSRLRFWRPPHPWSSTCRPLHLQPGQTVAQINLSNLTKDSIFVTCSCSQ